MTTAAPRWAVPVGILCLLLYALPLFHPPASPPLGTLLEPDAGLLERIFPGVPAMWVLVRLLALAAGALLLSRTLARQGIEMAPLPTTRTDDPRRRVAGVVAIGIAVALLCASPWASALGPMGQFLYLSILFLPALVLTSRSRGRPIRSSRDAMLTAGVIAIWVTARALTDVESPRVVDVGERWQGWLDLVRFAAQRRNLLTDPFDPEVPGVGGLLFFLHGMPWFQLEVLTPTIRTAQLFQLAWLALAAAGVAGLAWIVLGSRLAPVAAAVFLFAPYTRFVAIFPGPSLAGPVYVTAVVLFAVLAVRWRSESAVAALGAAAGIAAALPTAVPVVGLTVAAVGWELRHAWRDLWRGIVAGLVSCAAVIVPAFPAVLGASRSDDPAPWHGSVSTFDAMLLGQLPLRPGLPAEAMAPWRTLDHVVSGLLAPFAHPRIATRLWGDVVFDPVGAALMAIGVVTCLRSLRTSVPARMVLLLFLAALSPALLVSPVDVVDIAHAVTLPVPAALLATVGLAAVGSWGGARNGGGATLAVTLAVCVSGTLVFDVVNPRILSASSFGIMSGVLSPTDAGRAIVLAYPKDSGRAASMLFTGPISAFGPRPVGYFEYGGGAFPADLTMGGKDLLFWSPGYEQDLGGTAAVCRQWPAATLYEIWDTARLGRLHGARVSDHPWEPHVPERRWHAAPCPAAGGG